MSLVTARVNIPQKMLRAAVESFRGRIERVIAAKLDYVLFCEALK